MPSAAIESSCTHCGLPVRGGTIDPGRPRFCCIGCRLAAAISGGPERVHGLSEARLFFSAVLAMGVMTFSLILYSDPTLNEVVAEGELALRRFGQVFLAVLSLPVFFLLGIPMLEGAILDLKAHRIRMDGLIILAVLSAMFLSLIHTVQGHGAVYWETAVVVLVLITLGRRLEAHARTKGKDAAQAMPATLPEVTHRLTAQGTTEPLRPDSLLVGDTVVVRPGEALPADVEITEGASDVRAAHLTGEEAPQSVEVGDRVLAGTTNLTGLLKGRVLAPARGGSLGRILALLEAPLPTTRALRTVDRLAGALAGFAIVLALTGGVLRYREAGTLPALQVALATLLVACPCALGLAIPLAYRAMRAALARQGILVHDPVALEVLPRVRHVAVDKTGTLTEADALHWIGRSGDVKALAALDALVLHSGHALGHAVDSSQALPPPQALELIPGQGVRGKVEGEEWIVGRPEWVRSLIRGSETGFAEALREWAERGASLVAAAQGGEIRAVAAAMAPLRPGAAAAFLALQASRCEVRILSGDRQSAVQSLAAALGVASDGELTPQGKVGKLEALREQGHCVAMVGDGVNDAPALHAADVSIAISSGTQAARSEAQIEILGDDFRALPRLFEGARRLRRTVRGNLAWTVLYNSAAVVVAALGHLHPLVAVAVMILSSAAVSFRSFRLLEFGKASP